MINALGDHVADFIRAQPMFFVATGAPEGRVNVSLKGMDFAGRRAEPDRVAQPHGKRQRDDSARRHEPSDDLMFMSITADPLILRVFGTAQTLHPRDPDWSELMGLFRHLPDHARSST